MLTGKVERVMKAIDQYVFSLPPIEGLSKHLVFHEISSSASTVMVDTLSSRPSQQARTPARKMPVRGGRVRGQLLKPFHQSKRLQRSRCLLNAT
jgi:hypothetical protein